MKRALVALALLTAACTSGTSGGHAASSTTPTTVKPARPVRIGVWMPPDPAANTYGGVAIRDLVYPQLFRATPAGAWEASLVQPGTDKTGAGATTASFSFRRGARWSDGTPITAGDLRRTLDGRFVSAVDDPTPSGTIVVHFTQALPGWRRLWSGLAPIMPVHDGVYGGPYQVGTVTPGLETVLVPNARWYGTKPAINEVHVVLVPDPEIAARLLDRGELDVMEPAAFTGRTQRLTHIKDATVLHGDARRGGWTAAIVANPAHLNLDQRSFLFAYANAPRFTDVLLHDEATSTAPATQTSAHPAFGATPAFAAPEESSPGGVLLHAMQRKAHKAGFDFDLRESEFDTVLGAYATGNFDALLRLEPTSPTVCWTCSFAAVDAALAKQADAGDHAAQRAIRAKLASEALELPLWRERPEAAVRNSLVGVSPNGFDVRGVYWNLESWRWK